MTYESSVTVAGSADRALEKAKAGGNFTANQIKLLLGCDEKRKLRKEEIAEKEEDEKVTTAQRYNSSSSANWSNSNWGLAPPRRGLNGSGINRGNSAPRSTNSNNNNINHGAVIDLQYTKRAFKHFYT